MKGFCLSCTALRCLRGKHQKFNRRRNSHATNRTKTWKSQKSTGGHTPIIAMTAHAMKGDKERCLASGMDAYLSKPIRGSDLFELVEGSLQTSPEELETKEEPTERFDGEALLAHLEGNTRLCAQLIGTFLKEIPHPL